MCNQAALTLVSPGTCRVTSMRQLLLNVAGLFFAVLLVLPAGAQPANNPFPTNSIEARTAIRTSLQAIGSFSGDALQSRAALQRLADDLAKRYSNVPALDEIKRLLLLLEP